MLQQKINAQLLCLTLTRLYISEQFNTRYSATDLGVFLVANAFPGCSQADAAEILLGDRDKSSSVIHNAVKRLSGADLVTVTLNENYSLQKGHGRTSLHLSDSGKTFLSHANSSAEFNKLMSIDLLTLCIQFYQLATKEDSTRNRYTLLDLTTLLTIACNPKCSQADIERLFYEERNKNKGRLYGPINRLGKGANGIRGLKLSR